MPDLKHRQQKIQEKRKKTSFRDFVKEICSWYAIILYKNDGQISKHPKTNRKTNLIPFPEFDKIRDNLTDKGINYKIGKSFLEQCGELLKITEFPALVTYAGSENCEFADGVLGSKNVYLSFGIISDCENILYSITIKNNCTNILGGNWISQSENIYISYGITHSFNIFYSKYLNNCNNIWFSANLIGCSECIRCNNLNNQSYCIDNIEYNKKEYLERKKEIMKEKQSFAKWHKNLKLGQTNINSTNVEGLNIINSKDIKNAYNIINTDTGRNLISVGGKGKSENMYDVYGSTPECIDTYGSTGVGVGSSNIYNSSYIVGSTNIYYSHFIESCSYCLGCVGLRNKQFCILNKQYSKEERFELADKIFKQMEEDGILGDFFPGLINPLYFNDTVAYLIDDSFTKEEVEKEGYLRRDEAIKVDVPDGLEVVDVKDLENYEGRRHPETKAKDPSIQSNIQRDSSLRSEGHQRRIDLAILKKVIKDEKGNYYRIVKMEYDFLMKYGLPLPRLHWLDRIKLGFKLK